jgi:hypothetical protein
MTTSDLAARTCTRCGLRKPIGAFPERSRGSGKRQSHCRACKAAYQREWYEQHRAQHKANVAVHSKARIQQNRDIIQRAKAVPCTDCGFSYPPYVMDFDHVRGTKLGTIASWYVSISGSVLRAEIAKCEVVCAKCHRRRTHRRRNG